MIAGLGLAVTVEVLSGVGCYTLRIERPEGIKIASVFILAIVLTSMVSRALRSTELRVLGVETDPLAKTFIDDMARGGEINLIANRPGPGDRKEYEDKLREARETHRLTALDSTLFLEVKRGDASEFSDVLVVHGATVDGYNVLRCKTREVLRLAEPDPARRPRVHVG